jgi:predicted DCC family thiol-disulfide oxidoreductase YuxK
LALVSAPSAKILYDADCRFCRWSLAWLLRWDRRRALEPVALQDSEAARLLAGMDERRRMASWHLVGPDGWVASGGSAAAPLLRLLPGGGPLARVLERLPGPVERGYAAIAARRGRLGRTLVGDRALRRADRLIAARRAGRARRGEP